MEEEQVKAFKTIEAGMLTTPKWILMPLFKARIKECIKTRRRAKEEPQAIFDYYTDEPVVVRILAYYGISLEEFKRWCD